MRRPARWQPAGGIVRAQPSTTALQIALYRCSQWKTCCNPPFAPSPKPARGNRGAESGRKHGRTPKARPFPAQFGSGVVIGPQNLARMNLPSATARHAAGAIWPTASDVRRSRRPTPCRQYRSAPRAAAQASARWSRAAPGSTRFPPPARSARSSARQQGPGPGRRY